MTDKDELLYKRTRNREIIVRRRDPTRDESKVKRWIITPIKRAAGFGEHDERRNRVQA